VAFAAAFVVLSTRSIVWGVFALDAPPAGAASLGPACAARIAALARALDGAVAATAAARTEDDAVVRMRAALSPEWDREALDAAQCAQDPRGTDAWAALLRLRRAEERAVGRRAVDTGPIHQELEAYLQARPNLDYSPGR
jgi:hypothetical protein